MMKAAVKPSASPCNRSQPDGLTLSQQNAVDLLAAGKNDTETAALLNLNRVTVTRWRLYSPEFRAALAVRRADIWGASAARLQALVPKAVDALADALESTTAPDQRAKLAIEVLKLLGPLPAPTLGSTDPEDYVREVVAQEREQHTTSNDDFLDELDGLPDYDGHCKRVRKQLARLASFDDPRDDQQPPKACESS